MATHDPARTVDLEGLQVYTNERDERMQRIVGRLNLEAFKPTWWAASAYPQMALFGFWQATNLMRNTFERTVLVCPDGGEVAVDRLVEPAGCALPEDAPVVIFLHTLTGGRYDTTEFMRYALSRGWRPFLLVRRGHLGDFLKAPKFNVLGCTDDTTLMMDHIAEQWPKARFVGSIGISAGSGQVVSYISRQREGGPVQAAVSLCPAYSLLESMGRLQTHSPLLERLLLANLKLFFLVPNRSMLAKVEGYKGAMSSASTREFIEASYKLAGYESIESYLEGTDPIRSCHENKVPCLILNAADDPVCVRENIKHELATSLDNFALLVTDQGSHIAYREGAYGQSSYMHRISMDFLEASMAELACEPDSKK